MSDPVRVLIIEDSVDDAALLQEELRGGGLGQTCERVDSVRSFRAALEREPWDVVLSGYAVSELGTAAAITIVKDGGHDVPLIVVAAAVPTPEIVALLKAGAQDVVEKDDLGRLTPCVERAVNSIKERRALTHAQEAARASEERYRRLVDLSPDGILVHTDGIIVFANETMARILGVGTPDRLVDLTAIDFIPPEDRGTVLERRRLAAEDKAQGFREARFMRLDGSLIDVERAITTIPWQNRPSFLVVARDITQRRRAEKALRDSEAMLRLVTDNVPALISYVDRDQRIRFANEKIREWFNRRPDEIVGMPVREVRGEEAYAASREHYEKVFAGFEASYEGERRVANETRYFRVTYIPHFGEDGDVQGYFVLGIDTTERRRMREALRESEERFRAVFDNSPSSIYLLDVDERFLLTNAEFQRRFGMSEEEIVGKTGFDIQPPETAGHYSELNREVLSENRAATRVECQIYPDGTPRTNLVIKFPIRNSDGEPVAVGSINTDISEIEKVEAALHQSETKFRGLVEGSLQGILILGAGKPQYANAEFARMFGYTTEEIMALRSIYDLVHPEDQRHAIGHIEGRDSGRSAPSLFEFRGLHKSGGELWLYAKSSVVEWEGETATYVAVIEVTERKETEQQLRHAQKMEAMGQLTGGVAHDFSNVLTIILGNLQLIDRTLESDSAARDLLITAKRAVLRGSDLTQRLLAFSSQQPLSPKVTDLNELIDRMSTLLYRTLGEQVEVKIVPTPELWPIIVDVPQLENALANLALNSRDAMPKGGKLRIETGNTNLGEDFVRNHGDVVPGDYVAITISDTGMGMEREVLEQAFDPFFTTKDSRSGSGLGLSMVYGFIKQSGGHAEIESEPGEGSTVRLYLPRALETADEVEDARIDEFSFTGSESILVVEDDADVRMYVSDVLNSLGYRVWEAPDGPTALNLLREGAEADLLFTDIVLPGGMNGVAIADEAEKIRPGIKVVYTSGYTQDAFMHPEGAVEEVELLAKPYSQDLLVRMIRQALDRGSG